MSDEEKKDQDQATDEAAPTSPEGEAESRPEGVGTEEEKAASSADDAGDDTEEVEVPDEYKDLIEKIENMTVLELHGLVKVLEKKFGVSAAAVAVAGGGGASDEGEEEKSEFTVHLAAVGDGKIGVIKAVKELFGLGLKEAKDLVEGAPADLKADVKKEEAEEMKAKLEEAGATVELK